MTRNMIRGLVLAGVTLLVATPLLAYTVFLTDGSTIVADEAPRIEGERVIITLPNGTETFVLIDEYDQARTEDFNANNVHGAMLLEGGETKALPMEVPEERSTLRDLIVAGEARTRGRDPVRRQTVAVETGPIHTSAGFLDLDSLEREAYADADVMSDLRSYFTSQGLDTRIFRGSQGTHPLVEVITNSEAAVFKTLEVAAQALPQLLDRHAQSITALELLMLTENGAPAGQFVLTPEMASRLNSGETEIAAFFVREVQF